MGHWQDFLDAFSLFREPIAAGAAAGIGLGILSVFIVLRRVVFLSATLAQSAGLGVTLSFLLHTYLHWSLPPIVGAIVLSLLVIAILSIDTERMGTTREAMLGFLFLSASAGALIIGTYITQEAHDIQSVLFGSAVLVQTADLWLLVAGALIITGLVTWLWRGLIFAAFDEESAKVQGVPAGLLIGMLLTLVIGMNSIATRALGALPVFALSTLPAVAALGFTKTLPHAVVLAAVIGGVGAAGGYMLAFFLDWPVGSSQTICVALFAAVGLLFRRLRS